MKTTKKLGPGRPFLPPGERKIKKTIRIKEKNLSEIKQKYGSVQNFIDIVVNVYRDFIKK